jgi:hypothetical protein
VFLVLAGIIGDVTQFFDEPRNRGPSAGFPRSVNHVLAEGESADDVMEGAVRTSGAVLGRSRSVIKMDAEGFERVLELLQGSRSGSGNTLYVRDVGRLGERVRGAPRVAVGRGWSL